MCQALEEWLEDNRRIGVEQGIEQAMFRIVCKKIRKNYTLDMIADDLEESVEVIKPLYEKTKKEITRKKRYAMRAVFYLWPFIRALSSYIRASARAQA